MDYTAGADDAPKRLDRLMLQLLPELTRGTILKALRTGRIRLNGIKAPLDHRVSVGDLITLAPGLWEDGHRMETSSKPIKINLHEIYRGKDLIILNKAPGQDVQAQIAPAIQHHLPPGDSLSFRPAPLHRLDKGTSGILCCSASLAGAQAFSSFLRNGILHKYYLALVCGGVKGHLDLRSRLEKDTKAGKTLETPEGKDSRTLIDPLYTAGGRTLVLCTLETGRTHQIRAQCAAAGHPLAGDGIYGGGELPGGFILHAWILDSPKGVSWPQRIQAPLPPPSEKVLLNTLGLSETKFHDLLIRARPPAPGPDLAL